MTLNSSETERTGLASFTSVPNLANLASPVPLSPFTLPPIQADANKYTRGSLLVLAGSTRYFGAGVLAAQAAARTGAGYVTLATPGKEAARAARAHLTSIPIIQAHDKDGAFAHDAFKDDLAALTHIDAIVLGCGITVSDDTQRFTEQIIQLSSERSIPLLLDADALNVLALSLIKSRQLATAQLILTPHAGELARLLDATKTTTAQELAGFTNSVVVAKGPQTTITSEKDTVLSANGSPALATAGTGDVLAGVIGSLLAQGMPAFAAAQAGVEIHSLAGRLAAETQGERSVVAQDVIDALPQAIKQLYD